MNMKNARRSLLFLFLFLVLLVGVPGVSAGPLQSFAESPIPYWVDNSVNVDIDWDSSVQTVTFENGSVYQDWYDDDWSRCKAISVTGSAGAGANYQVLLSVTYDADMQSDFDDLRFLDNDNVTLLDYWIQDYVASTSANIWVEVKDSLETAQTMFMYYKNAAVADVSNGDSTFIFFDDFEDNDLTEWSTAGAYWSVQSVVKAAGTYAAYGDAGATGASRHLKRTVSSIDYGFMIDAYWRKAVTNQPDSFSYPVATTTNGIYAVVCQNDATFEYYDGAYKDYAHGTANAYSANTWYHLKSGYSFTDHKMYLWRDTTYIGYSDNFKEGVSPFNNVADVAELRLMIDDTAGADTWIDNYIVRRWVYTEPVGTFGSEESYFGYLYDGTLDVRVPIMRQATQSIEFMGNFSGLDSTVRFQFYDNNTASGLYCDVNSTHVVFPGDGYTGYDYAEFTDFARIKFTVNEERRIFKVYAITKEQSIINYYTNYEGRGNNNYFRMSDAALNGSFSLWYLQGDTRYLEVVNVPEWTSSGTFDADVEQSQLSLKFSEQSNTVLQNVMYSVSLPEWGYMRSEWKTSVTMEFDNLLVYNEFNLTTYVILEVDGMVVIWWIEYVMWFEAFPFEVPSEYCEGVVEVYDDGVLVWSDGYSKEGTWVDADHDWEQFINSRIASWRTQENHLGVMEWGYVEYPADYAAGNVAPIEGEGTFVSNGPAIFSDSLLSGTNETSVYITDRTLDDWDANLTIGYYLLQGHGSTSNLAVSVSFDRMEYAYWMPAGIVQPHFSSTFFEYGRGAGQGLSGGTGDVNYVNPDAYDNPPPSDEAIVDAGGPPNIFLDPLGWIWWHINNALAWLGNFIVGGLASIGTFMVDALVAGALMLAALWNGLLDLISPGLGAAIAGFLGSIPASIGAIGGVIVSGISWLISIVGMIVFWISWALSWVGHHAELFFWFGIILVLNTYTVKGFAGVAAIGYFLANLGLRIVGILWNFILSIVNLISGFIPFT